MTFDEALKILGLDNNYSESQLRKKFHDLARIYHPDGQEDKSLEEQEIASEKMKEINEAYDILTKSLKEGKKTTESNANYSNNNASEHTVNYSSDIFDNWNWYNINELNNYRDSKTNIIKKYILTFNFKCKFLDKANFNQFVNESIFKISNAKSKIEIDEVFLKFTNTLEKIYKEFKNRYFKINNIPENTPFAIDTNLTFEEFFKKLEDINKNKQANIITEEVHSLVASYQLRENYEDLQNSINDLMNNTIDTLLLVQDSFNYELLKNNHLNQLKSNIDELFKRASVNKPLYLELLEIINKYNLPFKDRIENLKNKIGDPLFPIYYQELKADINNLLELLDHGEEIKNIENNLAIRFNEAINSINDPQKQKLIISLYQSIISNLSNISFEGLMLLNEINFYDYDEALRIYNKVKNNLITDKNIEVYLCDVVIGIAPIKHVKVDGVEYNLTAINKQNVLKKDKTLFGQIVSLDDFMKKAIASFTVGENKEGEEVIILFELNSLKLCLYKGHLEFFDDIKKPFIIQNKTNPNDYQGRLQDRNYIISLIINDCYRTLKISEKKDYQVIETSSKKVGSR